MLMAARGASVDIRDIDGHLLKPFEPTGGAQVLFFVATDCPISNSYAPEIQRVCQQYGTRGVSCALLYEDLDIGPSSEALDQQVRAHLRDYRYAGIPAAVDRQRTIATRAGATTTPQAVVVDRSGQIRYRGRIDNFYAALGKPRQQVTEHDLRDALDAILVGRPVPKPETQALGCRIANPAFLRK
jgi:thiol-disulfide isomerase/thioredoxin